MLAMLKGANTGPMNPIATRPSPFGDATRPEDDDTYARRVDPPQRSAPMEAPDRRWTATPSSSVYGEPQPDMARPRAESSIQPPDNFPGFFYPTDPETEGLPHRHRLPGEYDLFFSQYDFRLFGCPQMGDDTIIITNKRIILKKQRAPPCVWHCPNFSDYSCVMARVDTVLSVTAMRVNKYGAYPTVVAFLMTLLCAIWLITVTEIKYMTVVPSAVMTAVGFAFLVVCFFSRKWAVSFGIAGYTGEHVNTTVFIKDISKVAAIQHVIATGTPAPNAGSGPASHPVGTPGAIRRPPGVYQRATPGGPREGTAADGIALVV